MISLLQLTTPVTNGRICQHTNTHHLEISFIPAARSIAGKNMIFKTLRGAPSHLETSIRSIVEIRSDVASSRMNSEGPAICRLSQPSRSFIQPLGLLRHRKVLASLEHSSDAIILCQPVNTRVSVARYTRRCSKWAMQQDSDLVCST